MTAVAARSPPVHRHESVMRWIPKIVQAIIVAIALYFILVWGCEAVWTLTSENYGVDDTTRAQSLRALGRLLDLGRGDLIRLAAFIAAFKLTAVAALAIHLIGRARAAVGATSHYDMLEAALLLVAILTGVIAVAAVSENNGAVIRHCAVDLLIAGVATILSVIERVADATRARAGDAPARSTNTAAAKPAGMHKVKRVSSWSGR
jgi:hypothetical protein